MILLLMAACGGEPGGVASQTLVGSDESAELRGLGPDGSTTVALHTELGVGAPINLREAPAPDARILMVLPQGATVTVVERTTPDKGYYRVEYFGRTGWAYGHHLELALVATSSALTDEQQENILERARRSVGYSYWWGGGRFGCDLGRGDCNGSCPGCTHVGEGGADCSGMVAKAWAVPASAPGTCVNGHPYSTGDFSGASYHWRTIERANIAPADAFVTRGSGHIMIRGRGVSSAGWPNIIECSGCAAGCIHHYRAVSSDDYKVIRRDAEL
ncbi:putative Membrane Spanning Protein [Cystobacter fuscus DSM 2262]|uniref:Membrane Spanning Protein n=2 Tax=Cystobacter fuscus TaxID=43 RepID=S9P4S7_CYSF2|nr:putative Membrane Spanning Protein [Cystobacter fuscus DSM 2262]